jgi:hypothetical protein
MYLREEQFQLLSNLLKTFFTLPYSTDLDGKDAEKLIRIAKGATGRISKRKELFDIIDGNVGYSVKTLRKSPNSARVDLQEQRFCDVNEIRQMMAEKGEAGDQDREEANKRQGEILLHYMRSRVTEQMKTFNIETAKSIILLKWWNKGRTQFEFRYWEEDFLGYIDELWDRNKRGEIEWVLQSAGIHARDKDRIDDKGNLVRLLRMHHKHNQIFTDHDIPHDAQTIKFSANPLTWAELAQLLVSRAK